MKDQPHNNAGLYALILPKLRVRARQLGYALTIHGSLINDLDVVAVPWVEEAAPAETLVEALAETVGGFVPTSFSRIVHNNKGPWKTEEKCAIRPHGRRTWNISWGGLLFVDLSVMPLAPAIQQAAARRR